MPAFILGYSFAFACAVIVILGDTMIKLAADKGHSLQSSLVLAGCTLYSVSALAWFLAMRHITLGQAAVAYTMISLVLLVVIGALFFGETIALREKVGIACAVAAVMLMARFA